MQFLLWVVVIVLAAVFVPRLWSEPDNLGPRNVGYIEASNAAIRVVECANKSDENLWSICLDAVSSNARLDPQRVAAHVNDREGRQVFATTWTPDPAARP
jgi:hypothetical protein